jgi:ankyrin repeat protein
VRAVLRRLTELEATGRPAQAVVDARDKHGRTALWLACYEKHADVVEALMAYGADYHLGMYDFEVNDPRPTLWLCRVEFEQMKRDGAPGMDEFEDADDYRKAKLEAWRERKESDPFIHFRKYMPNGLASVRNSFACIRAMKVGHHR